ncbi:MAG: hypothetical protein ABFS12_03680 [Bacteroidota bacterium]
MKNSLFLVTIFFISFLFFSCEQETIDISQEPGNIDNSQIYQNRVETDKSDFYAKRQLISCATDFINTVNPPEPDMSWISSNLKPEESNGWTINGVNIEQYSSDNYKGEYNSDHDIFHVDPLKVVTTVDMDAFGQITSLKSTIDDGYAKLKPYPLFNVVDQVPTYYNMIKYRSDFVQNMNGESSTYLNAYLIYLDCIHKAKTGWTVQEWLDAT